MPSLVEEARVCREKTLSTLKAKVEVLKRERAQLEEENLYVIRHLERKLAELKSPQNPWQRKMDKLLEKINGLLQEIYRLERGR